MPSAAPFHRTVAISLVIIAAATTAVTIRGGGHPADVEVTRAAVIAPEPSGDVVAAAANGRRRSGCGSSMLQWTNEARSAHGLEPLSPDEAIQPIALEWTERMARNQHLAHDPGYGAHIFHARPEAVTAGENVGRGNGSERGLFDALMASSGHRDNILGAEYANVAVACIDATGQLWTTMVFWG